MWPEIVNFTINCEIKLKIHSTLLNCMTSTEQHLTYYTICAQMAYNIYFFGLIWTFASTMQRNNLPSVKSVTEGHNTKLPVPHRDTGSITEEKTPALQKQRERWSRWKTNVYHRDYWPDLAVNRQTWLLLWASSTGLWTQVCSLLYTMNTTLIKLREGKRRQSDESNRFPLYCISWFSLKSWAVALTDEPWVITPIIYL